MRKSFLTFSPPSVGEAEISEVVETLRSGWITTGPRTARFEEEFAGLVGAQAALALNSGTAALHLALLASRIGDGDVVVVSPLTFCSAVHVVEHVGARPVFADVDPHTLNIDPVEVERQVESCESRVSAIMPVHLHGQPCDMDALIEIASKLDACIIDDAAHALPAAVGNRRIGQHHDKTRVLTAFSFYATKNLTTGEGGMLTGPADLVAVARKLSLHGMDLDAWNRYGEQGTWGYDVTDAGFKYNMSDIQAAIGLVQLGRLGDMHARRFQIAARYSAAFAELDALQTPSNTAGDGHAWHIYALRIRPEILTIGRNEFVNELRQRNIGCSVHFIPVHTLTYYRHRYGFKPDDFPVAFNEFQRLISLPLHPGLSDEDVNDVIEAVSDVVAKNRR